MKGRTATAAAGGALSANLANRLIKAAISADGRCLVFSHCQYPRFEGGQQKKKDKRRAHKNFEETEESSSVSNMKDRSIQKAIKSSEEIGIVKIMFRNKRKKSIQRQNRRRSTFFLLSQYKLPPKKKQ